MRFEFKIKDVLCRHSFDSYLISVVTILDKEDNLYKGIAVTPVPISCYEESVYSEAMGDPGKPLIIETEQSIEICGFIEDVLKGSLPKEIYVKSNGPPLRIKLKKYIKNWHDGGAYKGSVAFGRSIGFGLFSNSTVSKNSLVNLKKSLINLFELDRDDINA